MKSERVSQDLGEYLGTPRPVWKFSHSSDSLVLSAAGSDREPTIRVRLTAPQAAQIRCLTGVTTMLSFDVDILGRREDLHLIGKKISEFEWAGVAASLRDAAAVASNAKMALAFAEAIVSEVNAIVVILDRNSIIHRFNRMAEEYTGLKEENVVGKNAQELFMSMEEGRASRANILKFFEQGSVYDVQRVIETVSGPRTFLFRNKFIPSMSGSEAEFIVCSGVELDAIDKRSEDAPRESGRFDAALSTVRQLSSLLMLASTGPRALDALPPDVLQDILSLGSELSEQLRKQLVAACRG